MISTGTHLVRSVRNFILRYLSNTSDLSNLCTPQDGHLKKVHRWDRLECRGDGGLLIGRTSKKNLPTENENIKLPYQQDEIGWN